MDVDRAMPTPGEWHPWYEGHRTNQALLDWLQSDDPSDFALPVQRAPRLVIGDEPAIPAPEYPVLRKRLVYSGPEEYRARLMNPGINWYVATDQYGRSICGRPFAADL